MGKLIVVIVIVAAVAFAWQQGYIGKWTDAALDSVDSGAASMRKTQREATQKRGD
jgi:hypothetical protein